MWWNCFTSWFGGGHTKSVCVKAQTDWKTVKQKIQHKITMCLAITLLSIRVELKAESQTNISIPMFTAAVFTTGKWWNNPDIHWRMNKVYCIRTMEYHSFFQQNKIVTHVTTWMKRQNIRLSEIAKYRRTNILFYF